MENKEFCLPMKSNVPEGHKDWKQVNCNRCSCECWMTPTAESMIKAGGMIGVCTECAVKSTVGSKDKTDNIITNEEIVQKLFPSWKSFEKNKMTPTIANFGTEKVVAFLILGDEELLQDFRKEGPRSNVKIHVKMYTQRNQYGIGTDLVIRMDFLYSTGTPRFETVIYGHLGEGQKDFCKALIESRRMYVFVATNEGKVIKIKIMPCSFSDNATVHKLLNFHELTDKMSKVKPVSKEVFMGYCFTNVNGDYLSGVRLIGLDAALQYVQRYMCKYPEIRIVNDSEEIVLHAVNGQIVFPRL